MTRHLLSLSLIVALLAAASAQNPPTDGPFAFALIADMPYSPTDSVRFGRLVEEINRAEGLEWVIHVGDIKGGSSPVAMICYRAASSGSSNLNALSSWLRRQRLDRLPPERIPAAGPAGARAGTLFFASGVDYRPTSHARRHPRGQLPRARALDPRADELCGAAHRRQSQRHRQVLKPH